MRIYSNTFKSEYPNTVFLEKHGIFYYAYGENALVLSGICNYQFKDNRCGFPINSLINDVKKVIESNRENYYKLKEFVDSL